MKKIALFLIVVMLCLSLAACEPGFGRLEFIRRDHEITSVELVDYDNPDRLVVRHGLIAIFVRPADYAPFENDRCTPIETLPEEKTDAFFEQMSAIGIIHGMGNTNYNSPQGICLKINCADGTFFIIEDTDKRQTFCAEYSADGGFVRYHGEPDDTCITPLINEFFEYKISVE